MKRDRYLLLCATSIAALLLVGTLWPIMQPSDSTAAAIVLVMAPLFIVAGGIIAQAGAKATDTSVDEEWSRRQW